MMLEKYTELFMTIIEKRNPEKENIKIEDREGDRQY
jgi:hypothetical protein